MRNEQNEEKHERRCRGKKYKSVTQILKKTTMPTRTIISTATQLICLDIEHGYDQRMRENLQTHIL